MARPSKPVGVIEYEKRSHRTKAEIAKRKEGEEKLLTGLELKERKEVKENKAAHTEFLRLKRMLKTIEKNDSLYEPVINRYALLQAECRDFEEKREIFYRNIRELQEEKKRMLEEKELTIKEYFRLENDMQKQIINLDRQVQSKRKMLLEIEKENVMTIAAALRGVPKKENKEDEVLKILRGS